MKKERPLKFVFPIVLAIIFIGIGTAALDYYQMRNGNRPIFCIRIQGYVYDTCYGFGYTLRREVDPYRNPTNVSRYYNWFSRTPTIFNAFRR